MNASNIVDLALRIQSLAAVLSAVSEGVTTTDMRYALVYVSEELKGTAAAICDEARGRSTT